MTDDESAIILSGALCRLVFVCSDGFDASRRTLEERKDSCSNRAASCREDVEEREELVWKDNPDKRGPKKSCTATYTTTPKPTNKVSPSLRLFFLWE